MHRIANVRARAPMQSLNEFNKIEFCHLMCEHARSALHGVCTPHCSPSSENHCENRMDNELNEFVGSPSEFRSIPSTRASMQISLKCNKRLEEKKTTELLYFVCGREKHERLRSDRLRQNEIEREKKDKKKRIDTCTQWTTGRRGGGERERAREQ